MLKYCLYVLPAVFCLAAAAPAEIPVEVTPKGVLRIDGNLFQVICHDAEWRPATQESNAFRVRSHSGDAADFKLEGEFRLKESTGSFQQNLRRTAEGSFAYRADLRFPAPLNLKAVALTTSLPVTNFGGQEILVNGKQKILLPADYKPGAGHMLHQAPVTELQLPVKNGKLTIRGNFELAIQDGRAFKSDRYTFRLLFTPPRGDISAASLALELQTASYRTTPLDLSGAVNAGFVDETEGDRKGGWTDQGPVNDLRMLKTGRVNLNGVKFDIIDPERNHGNSCIMLAGPARQYFARRAEAVQSRPVQGNYLYLLHALAWPVQRNEIGKVTVNYLDGGSCSFPVTSEVDVGNWWAPTGLKNGEVAWTVENSSANVGLYRSNHPIENKPIKSVVFDSANRSVWGVVAASVGMDAIPLQRIRPYTVTENAEWKPVTFNKDVERGSILDFSGRLDAPAGKHGPVVNRNGKFSFRDRPETPVRFYGTNLCMTAQYLSKEWAEKLADRLAAAGYNAVRYHHQDARLSGLDEANKRSTDLHRERLDQLDYLMYCMARRGIYYTTDLYVSRPLAEGELPEIPDRKIVQREFKALVFVLDSAMANWKTFAKNWLTHVNPYTGYALKDDPALISLSLINENVPKACWNATPESEKLYRARFEVWETENPSIANDQKLSGEQRFSLFLTDNYERGYREMRDFLRHELGVEKLLTDMNHHPEIILQFSRNLYDYVDNHFYHDHPNFPEKRWRLPSTLSNGSVLRRTANPPSRMFATRIFGKPMTITEFDYAKPNGFRAEGPVVAGAYAALQDWDALFHFAYAHNREGVMNETSRGGHFDSSDDVVKTLSQRIGIRLFLGGEMKAAPVAFPIVLDTPNGLSIAETFPPQILELGLIARTGSLILRNGDQPPPGYRGFVGIGRNSPKQAGGTPVFDGAKENRQLLKQMIAAGALAPEWYDAENGIYRSSSGQIVLNTKKLTFQAVSSGCEAFVLPEKRTAEGEFLKVENRIGRGVFALMSVDGKPLSEASRLLLFHLTDSQRSQSRFADKTMTRVESFGEPPHLIRRGEAEIYLKTPANYRLYAVDTAGKRLAEIPLTRQDTALHFSAKVFTPQGPVLAYELERQ